MNKMASNLRPSTTIGIVAFSMTCFPCFHPLGAQDQPANGGANESATASPFKARLEERRIALEKKEEEVQRLRDEIKDKLGDVRVRTQRETEQAKTRLLVAQKSREVAELNVTAYEQGVYPQELQARQGQVRLAEEQLARTDAWLKRREQALADGKVTAEQLEVDKLSKQKADYELHEARVYLDVLQRYGKERRLKELQALVERAKAEEFAAQAELLMAEQREARFHDYLSRFKVIAPDDQVLALLHDAIKLEEGIATTLREAKTVAAGPAEVGPDGSDSKAERLRKMHEDVVKMTKQATVEISEAIALAEYVRQERMHLMKEEADLQRARTELEALEKAGR
jgi:hypothetical protein